MAYLFESIAKGKYLGNLRGYYKKAKDFFNSTIKKLFGKAPKSGPDAVKKVVIGPEMVGNMYTFIYDAKTKDKLKYYDQFPVAIVIDFQGDRLLSLNLHYLSPYYRSVLLNALYELAIDDTKNQTQKLAITYGILKNVTRFRMYKPCIKIHLLGHIKSQIVQVPFADWDSVVVLPTESFVDQRRGGSRPVDKDFVWSESERMFR